MFGVGRKTKHSPRTSERWINDEHLRAIVSIYAQEVARYAWDSLVGYCMVQDSRILTDERLTLSMAPVEHTIRTEPARRVLLTYTDWRRSLRSAGYQPWDVMVLGMDAVSGAVTVRYLNAGDASAFRAEKDPEKLLDLAAHVLNESAHIPA